MRSARIVLTSVVVIGIGAPAAVAQQAVEGMITIINRLSGTVAIRQTQGGTVGVNNAAADQEFKVRDVSLLESVHAGDLVTYSTTDSGGVKTITRIQRKK